MGGLQEEQAASGACWDLHSGLRRVRSKMAIKRASRQASMLPNYGGDFVLRDQVTGMQQKELAS